MDSIKFFSQKRLSNYTDESEHRANFALIQRLTPKLGILEIVTRNLTFSIIKKNNQIDVLDELTLTWEDDDDFISHRTFGFWAKAINSAKIHNELVDFSQLDFRKYSKFNKRIKTDILNYKKVSIVYDLCVKIRNRAFHFENLYKLNLNGSPRISTKVGNILVGIDPLMLESFLDDVLDCFDKDLKEYV